MASASGKAQGAGGPGAAAPPSTTSERGEGSFRARWQSLLASLDDGANGPGSEAATAGGPQGTAEAPASAGAASALPATLLPGGAAATRWIRVNAQEDGPSLVAGKTASADSDPGIASAIALRMEAQKSALVEGSIVAPEDSPAAKTAPARSHAADSSHGKHAADIDKGAKKDLASSGPASAASILPATPASVAATPATPAANVKAHSSDSTASGFLSRRALPSDRPGASAGAAKAVGSPAGDAEKAAPTSGGPASIASADSLAAGSSEPSAGNLDGKDAPASDRPPSNAAGSLAPSSSAAQAAVQTLLPPPAQSLNPSQAQASDSGSVAAATNAVTRAGANAASKAGDAASSQPQPALPSAEASGLAGRAPIAKQAASPARGVAASLQVHPEHLHREATGTTPGSDASALVRDPFATHGAMDTAGGSSEGAAGASAAPPAHATFSALDEAPGPAAPNWIHAGARHAEAGFQDPALGWVGVRADLSGGSVHASLVPGSADAAQVLGGHMAGLHAYLAEHHTPVANVTLAQSEGRGGSWGGNQGTGHGMGNSSGENPGQGAYAQPHSDSQPGQALSAGTFASSQAPTHSAAPEALPAARRGGAYISVMA